MRNFLPVAFGSDLQMGMVSGTRKCPPPFDYLRKVVTSKMAMPQRDNLIEQIHRLEGLIAVAEQQKDWAELERLKERLRALIEQMA